MRVVCRLYRCDQGFIIRPQDMLSAHLERGCDFRKLFAADQQLWPAVANDIFQFRQCQPEIQRHQHQSHPDSRNMNLEIFEFTFGQQGDNITRL